MYEISNYLSTCIVGPFVISQTWLFFPFFLHLARSFSSCFMDRNCFSAGVAWLR